MKTMMSNLQASAQHLPPSGPPAPQGCGSVKGAPMIEGPFIHRPQCERWRRGLRNHIRTPSRLTPCSLRPRGTRQPAIEATERGQRRTVTTTTQALSWDAGQTQSSRRTDGTTADSTTASGSREQPTHRHLGCDELAARTMCSVACATVSPRVGQTGEPDRPANRRQHRA